MVVLRTFEFDLFLGFIGAIGQNSNNFALGLAERAHPVSFRDFIDGLAHGIPRLSEMLLICRKKMCITTNITKKCENRVNFYNLIFFLPHPLPLSVHREGLIRSAPWSYNLLNRRAGASSQLADAAGRRA